MLGTRSMGIAAANFTDTIFHGSSQVFCQKCVLLRNKTKNGRLYADEYVTLRLNFAYAFKHSYGPRWAVYHNPACGFTFMIAGN